MRTKKAAIVFSIGLLFHSHTTEMLRDASVDHDMAGTRKRFERLAAPTPQDRKAALSLFHSKNCCIMSDWSN